MATIKLSSIRIEMTREDVRKHAQYSKIPEHTLDSIYAFVNEGSSPGHFLTAVFSNDLIETIGRADKKTLACLPEIAIFIHNRVPSVCYQINGRKSCLGVERWMRWKLSDKDTVATAEN